MPVESEIRVDLFSSRQVLIAPNRDQRPNDFLSPMTAQSDAKCAFCAGNESQTPPPLAIYRDHPEDDPVPWIVRVVPNKYPVVGPDNTLLNNASSHSPDRPIAGVHELVIESPRHTGSFSALSKIERTLTIQAYRDRYRELNQRDDLKYVQIFKNNGAAAGASIEHVHSQIIGLDFIPPAVKRRQRNVQTFFEQTGDSLLQHTLQCEAAADRIVLETSNLIAYCPAASCFAYECVLSPRVEADPFADISDEISSEVADTLHQLVTALEAVTPQPAYNFVLHTPSGADGNGRDTWQFQLCPRLNQLAGFEWGTELYVNTVSPERAAAQLRDAIAR